jgi:hypothetical protein
MGIELTKEETENFILVGLDYLQQNSNYPENGVGLKNLAKNVNMELDEVRKFLKELKLKNAIHWHFDQTGNGEFYIFPTELTIEKFDKLNALKMNETAMLLLEKTYDIYRRAGCDSMFQFDGMFIGSIMGITNTSKIRTAIELLEGKGLINNPAFMSESVVYFISARGIDMIENGSDKQEIGNPIIINNEGGNVAVNSNNVRQTINKNELSEYFTTLEKLIKENLYEKEKETALIDLETIKELSKVDQPKIPLIQHILNNLDKFPILIETVNKIRELFLN